MSLDARPGRPVPGCGWIAPLAELPVGAVYADGDIVAIRVEDQIVRHAHPVRVLAWSPPVCETCETELAFDDGGVETFRCDRCQKMWPADFFTSVAAPVDLRLPSPVHAEANPSCSCIAAYLERELTDPQCPLDDIVEAVEAATGLRELNGVWGPPPAAEPAPNMPRHTEALLAGDRSAQITFRPARTQMVASDLWGPDEMPEHVTADDVAALVSQIGGRSEAVRTWSLADEITVTVSGPDSDFTSTKLD